MQEQTIKTLILVPNRDDFSKVKELFNRIKKWRFKVQWVPDADAAFGKANGNYDLIFVDYDLGRREVTKFLVELDKELCVTPVILLISEHEQLDTVEAVIPKTVGYLEKTTLNIDRLERLIRYAFAVKSAAERLRESEMRLRGIFYGAAIGIALFSLEGQIIEANPALSKITGFSNEELCNFYLKDLLGRRAESRRSELFPELVEGRRDYIQFEEPFKNKDGKNLLIRLTLSHFKNHYAPDKFIVGLFEDITERQQAEDEVRRTWEKMRELSRKILEAQENERRLVAQEIHDSIGGSLAAIKFALEEKLESMGQNPSSGVISLEKIIANVDETIKESRRISALLRPSLLDDLGLLATISWFCSEFEKMYPGIQIEQHLDVAEEEIPEMLKVVVYRVLQEALNNVAKHSDATRARLELGIRNNRIEFSTADNGCGFDPEEKFADSTVSSGFGLSGMRDRTILCDGKFEIITAKGKGTTVRISLPSGAGSIGGSM